MVDSRLLHVFI